MRGTSGARVICGDVRLTGVERGGSGSGRRMVSRGWLGSWDAGLLGRWDARIWRAEQDDMGQSASPYICPSDQVSKRTSDPVASQV